MNTEILATVRVAHQNFAIRLLNWLGELFNKYSGFRALFISVAQSTNESDFVDVLNIRRNHVWPLTLFFSLRFSKKIFFLEAKSTVVWTNDSLVFFDF